MNTREHVLRVLPLAGVLAVLMQANCLLIPEDVDVTDRVSNQRPVVRITAGATRPDTTGIDYKVRFHWHGYDSDGVVTHFQWAVNDTVSEGAWQDTTAFTARFNFSATTPDPEKPGEATDWHTFYVRAIDNDFAVSRPDKRFFNARTIAPTSEISFPTTQTLTPMFQRTVVVRWEGEDLDSSQPDRKPIAYDIKLVRIPRTTDPEAVIRDSVYNADNVLMDTLRVGSKKQWVRFPESTREYTLTELPPSGMSYAFAVRAVDEAGAIEPLLERGRNLLAFSVTAEVSAPFVTVREPSMGVHSFPTDGDVWDVDVPANRPIYLRWTGSAAHYGSMAGSSNYGLNIPDPEDESLRDPLGLGGWVGWGNWDGNRMPLLFGNEDGGTVQTFYLYMRDISDAAASTRRCTIRMRVIAFTFERFALAVDDARFSVGVPDNLHDAFLEETTYKRLRDFGDVDEFSVYSGVTERGDPQPVTLFHISQYRHVVWNHETYSANSSLRQTESVRRTLSAYLAAGGRLFVFGGQQSSAFLGNYQYPKLPPAEDDAIGLDRFFYKFLYFRNHVVSRNMNGACIAEAGGLYVARSRNPSYPDLHIDLNKRDPWEVLDMGYGAYRGGIPKWEGNKARIGGQPATPDLRLEGLDTLYVADTWDRNYSELCGEVQSPSRGAVCAQRYESTRADSLAGTQHGRVVTFNFVTWDLQPDRLLDANSAAINWLVTGRDQ